LEAELENIKIEFENYKNIETFDLPIETLEKQLKETITAIQQLGPINMKAIEEYEQQKVVYEELKAKVDKLEAEKEKILGVILEIENKRKETFYRTLEGIRNEFKKVFGDLVGGEADLVLEDPENIESGLLIQASPPGKKLLNIDALSVGEKTLTALAFLFAIQCFKPAPFYILDEIDAALDKANAKKVAELLKKYSDKSQFIVISHNDITIQTADCVYGVSMEDGESKIVGIKMPEE
jgi:chromosome segregation protein